MTNSASSPAPKREEGGLPPTVRWGATIILVAAHMGVALLLTILFKNIREESPFFFGIGVITAQASLLGCWAGLGPWRIVVRIPASLGLATLLWLAMFVVIIELGAPNGAEAIVMSALLTLSQYVLITLAGLLIRRSTGLWLARNDDHPSSAASSHQFSIRQMLVWTTGTALLLATSRFLVPDTLQFGGLELWMILLFFMLAIFSLATVLPALLLPMLNQLPWIAAAVLLILITGLVTGIEIGAFALIGEGGDGEVFLLINIGILFTTIVTQGIMRLCGYQLRPIPERLSESFSAPEME